MIERGNFALDLAFPDIEFIPQDRYPIYPSGPEIRAVQQRLRDGQDMLSATRPVDMAASMDTDMMATSNRVDRQEAFNTRYGSFRGWQMAIQRVKPIPRDLATLDLTRMVVRAELATSAEVIDYFTARFLTVPIDGTTRQNLVELFTLELGSDDVLASSTVLEEPLRLLLHLILSRPEYHLG